MYCLQTMYKFRLNIPWEQQFPFLGGSRGCGDISRALRTPFRSRRNDRHAIRTLPRGGSRLRFVGGDPAHESVHLPNEDEDRKRHDEKVERRVQEEAEVDGCRAMRFGVGERRRMTA